MGYKEKKPITITFGIIVLNGEPFTRYNLKSLYPFAHQIIVVEGSSPRFAFNASPEGHSIDSTLELLRTFKREEDPENKITIVTAEDEGYPNGFWPGHQTEQSQAYAKRATGNWLWQVDIDEFYQPEDIDRIINFLLAHPATTCLTFNSYHFWGGFDYILQGGLLMSRSFQGEPWGAFRRVFKWDLGYRYVDHEPPTVCNTEGKEITHICKHNMSRQSAFPPIYLYHYTNIFPSQVVPKGKFYLYLSTGGSQKANFENFTEKIDQKKGIRIFDHFGTYNWLRRFDGNHPPIIDKLRQHLDNGLLKIQLRPVDDISTLLSSYKYFLITNLLFNVEKMRSYFSHSIYFSKIIIKCAIISYPRLFQYLIIPILPSSYRVKLERLRDQ